MSFFDSPISRCNPAHALVLTDQTKGECMLDHGCPPGRRCPLDGCFAKVSGLSESEIPKKAVKH